MKNYDDIINLNRPISNHVKMPLYKRAAQFSPFAALTGYDDMRLLFDMSMKLKKLIEKLSILSYPDVQKRLKNIILKGRLSWLVIQWNVISIMILLRHNKNEQ